MRKTGTILFVAIFCMVSAATAQLSNTKWKGIVNSNGQVPVIWIFKKNTVDVISLPDSSIMESMTYKTSSGFLFINKINGMSNCDSSTIGKYSYRIKKDSMYLKAVDDACTQRSDAVSDDALIKLKK
jgi:hypothetical protein